MSMEQQKTTLKDIVENEHVRLWGGVALGIIVLLGGLFFLSSPATAPAGKTQADAVSETDWVRGDTKTAKAVLIEYSDFQCPACGMYHDLLKQLQTDTNGDIALVYRHFPLTAIHPNAKLAAQAAEAAGIQGKFFEMHDELFGNQDDWSEVRDPRDLFVGYAKKIGINEEQFRADIDSDVVKEKVAAAERAGQKVGIRGTPSFFMNGEAVPTARTYAEFKNTVLSRVYPPQQ